MENRRALRKKLGTRTNRRAGTKSKVIPSSHPGGSKSEHKPPKFRYPQVEYRKPSVRSRLSALINKKKES